MSGNRIGTCLMAIVLLCGFGHTEAFANIYERNAQSGSWGYQPVYAPMTSGSSLATVSKSGVRPASNSGVTMYGGGLGYGSASPSGNTAGNTSSMPTYNFHTTSSIINSLGHVSLNTTMDNEDIRRTSSWGWDDDDNPIGEVDDPVPVGDTPWLVMLLMAAGYMAFRRFRAQRK